MLQLKAAQLPLEHGHGVTNQRFNLRGPGHPIIVANDLDPDRIVICGSVSLGGVDALIVHWREEPDPALIDEEMNAPGALAGKTIIEIGTTRELRPPQNSTQKLAIFASAMDMRFVTVDMDPDNTKAAERILPFLNPAADAQTKKGELFLKTYAGALDYVYLDAFDFDHDQHSDKRRQRYQEFLNTDINDEECWLMHKLCAETIIERMPEGGIVALDDTWRDSDGVLQGKGKLAAPLLLQNGFKMVAETKDTLCLKRISI